MVLVLTEGNGVNGSDIGHPSSIANRKCMSDRAEKIQEQDEIEKLETKVGKHSNTFTRSPTAMAPQRVCKLFGNRHHRCK